MIIPTPSEAQALWLHATGLCAREIADAVGRSPATVSTMLTAAKRKAIAAGVRIEYAPTVVASTQESGMSIARRLAQEAGLI